MTSTPPTPDTTTAPAERTLDEQTANTVARLATLNQEIDERKKVADELKVTLRQLAPGAGRYWHDGREVLDLAEPGTQFNAKKAAEAIPVEMHAVCSDLVLSAEKCRAVLPPALYAKCLTPKAAAVKTL